ncbi:unnamed protein product [Camellia sinensis]
MFSDEGLPVSGDESMHEILQKALLRTIHDIDTKFSLEAFNNIYISGSTATIVLLVDGQILVASVGDSKALLCSEKIKAALGDEGASITVLDVEELTRDHHPDRDDERARIEAAGGFVRLWGVPRVNGSYTEDQPTSMEPQWLTSYPCCLLQRQSLLCIRLMDNRKKGIASTFHNLWNVCTAKDHRHLGWELREIEAPANPEQKWGSLSLYNDSIGGRVLDQTSDRKPFPEVLRQCGFWKEKELLFESRTNELVLFNHETHEIRNLEIINLVFLLGLLCTPDAVTCQRTYNQFQFVQAWIPTFCKKYSGCFPNLAPNFTLHGLWLATRTGNSVLNCGTSRWDYNIGPETMALAGPLASAWPSIIIGRKDKQLWQYEWDKHGTCCLSRMTKMDYFLSVIRERNKMDLLSILSNANIVPHSDVSYTKLDFENALTQFTGVGNSIYVSCYALNNTHVQLFEIYTCLNYLATQVIPCPVSTKQRGCTGSIVFLP